MKKSTLNKYYFQIKFENGVCEYANCTSEKSVDEIILKFKESFDTVKDWAKGNILESICECSEMKYISYMLYLNLLERDNKIEFDGRNKFMKHANPIFQNICANILRERYNINPN